MWQFHFSEGVYHFTIAQRRVASISDVTINKDIMTGSHFPRIFGVVVQCEKRSKSSSLYNFWKYRYFKWGSLLNPNGFEFVIFLYIICETFRSKQAEFTKLRVNLREIWRKFKCRKNRVRPPLILTIGKDVTINLITDLTTTW